MSLAEWTARWTSPPRQAQPARQLGRQVLQTVHRQVDAALDERELQLAGEDACAADVGQGARRVAVAAGFDRRDAEPALRIGPPELAQHSPGLGLGQVAAARSDDYLPLRAHRFPAAGDPGGDGRLVACRAATRGRDKYRPAL